MNSPIVEITRGVYQQKYPPPGQGARKGGKNGIARQGIMTRQRKYYPGQSKSPDEGIRNYQALQVYQADNGQKREQVKEYENIERTFRAEALIDQNECDTRDKFNEGVLS